MKLYELIERYEAIADLAFQESDDDGKLSQEFSAMLAALEDGIAEKFENCGYLIRNMQAMETALKAERDRLAKRAQQVGDRIDRLKDYLQKQLEELGETKYQAGIFSYRIQTNGGFPTVNITAEDLIPDAFWIQPPPVLDKRLICETAKEGGSVPGVELVRGNHLRIS